MVDVAIKAPQLECFPTLAAVGRDRTLERRVIEAAISVVFDIDIAHLHGSSRGEAHVALARQVAMYLAHCAFRLPYAEVGRMFGRDRTTVGHACGLVEDRRDDAVFDRTVANLEEIVRRLGAISGLEPAE